MNALWWNSVFVFCIYGALSLNDGQSRENEFKNANEDPVSKRNDGAASDMNIAPAKKEENGINYAVSQSPSAVQTETTSSPWINDILIIVLIACVSAATVIGIIIALICCCKMRKSAKETSDCDYPGYGSMDYKGSAMGTKSNGDRKLVQSAQMYHYQHQKQQMLEMEKNQNAIAKSGSDASSEEDNEGDEYTVYECPGLATPGELEVPNPLFSEPAATNLQSEVSQQPTESHEPKLFNGYKEP